MVEKFTALVHSQQAEACRHGPWGAVTYKAKGFCSDASGLRLVGRTLPAGVLMRFAGRLPVEAAVVLAGKLAGYWLDSPKNCQGATCKRYC